MDGQDETGFPQSSLPRYIVHLFYLSLCCASKVSNGITWGKSAFMIHEVSPR